MSTPLNELLRGNDSYLPRFLPSFLGFNPIKTSDIGYEVMPSRIASVSKVMATQKDGHIIFFAKQ